MVIYIHCEKVLIVFASDMYLDMGLEDSWESTMGSVWSLNFLYVTWGYTDTESTWCQFGIIEQFFYSHFKNYLSGHKTLHFWDLWKIPPPPPPCSFYIMAHSWQNNDTPGFDIQHYKDPQDTRQKWDINMFSYPGFNSLSDCFCILHGDWYGWVNIWEQVDPVWLLKQFNANWIHFFHTMWPMTGCW